jgi:squalene-hopene/tetraprenyl-beta-curcumene cyclase
VATAAALAFSDAATTKKLHPMTREALDLMWTHQRKDGSWNWLNCNWPPLESDDHYGVTLAALAVGIAPDDYKKTDAAKKGLEGIRAYLKRTPPTMPHHRAMLLWVSTLLDGFQTEAEKQATIKELAGLQKEDGGWNIATLGKWERTDDKAQDTASSDGYATGFVIYVLRRAGVPAKDPRIQKGIAWLKANQRESGRWFTRSLNRDGRHFISHAGSAFAVMALVECGEVKTARAP